MREKAVNNEMKAQSKSLAEAAQMPEARARETWKSGRSKANKRND